MDRNEFIRTLDEFGIVFKYLVNGLIGGIVFSIYKKSKFWEAIRQVFIGGMVSGYFTPVIVKQANLSVETVGFMSFVVGILGMSIIDSFYKQCVIYLKKIKIIKKILLKDDGDL